MYITTVSKRGNHVLAGDLHTDKNRIPTLTKQPYSYKIIYEFIAAFDF